MSDNHWTITEDPRGGYRLQYDVEYIGSQLTREEAEQARTLADQVDALTAAIEEFRDEDERLSEEATDLATQIGHACDNFRDMVLQTYTEEDAEVRDLKVVR